jgi:hypothetical protein
MHNCCQHANIGVDNDHLTRNGAGRAAGGLALGMLSCRKFFRVSVTPPSEMADASSSACARHILHV